MKIAMQLQYFNVFTLFFLVQDNFSLSNNLPFSTV